MSSKLSFTDINAWYTSLNTLQNKENISLGSVSVPNLNERQVRATDINDYINKLNALRTNEYFRYADWISISTVSSKDQIRDILKEDINTEITNLNKVCANYSVTSGNSTCSTNSTNNDSTCTTSTCTTFNNSASCSTNSTCATNSTYTGSRKGFFTHDLSTFNDTYVCKTSYCITFGFTTCGTDSTNSTTYKNYSFSVVSGKAVISNSKTSPR